MFAQPQKEHEWLQQLVGEWTFESECSMGPGQPTMKSTGSDTVRSLGGLWVLCEGQGEVPGGGVSTSLMTFGYDPQRKRYVGSFIASVMTHLWLYDGELDAAGKVLTLSTDGPSFTDPTKMVPYRDVIEIKNADYRTLTSLRCGEDGSWLTFMTAHYRRKK